MSEVSLPLSEFRPIPEVVCKETRVDRAKFPCIDAHMHLDRWVIDEAGNVADLLHMMEECNIQAMFNLMSPAHVDLDRCLAALKPRNRFYILTTIPWKDMIARHEDFGREAAKFLGEQFDRGVDGLKMYKDVSLTLKDRQGKLIRHDDPRLAPVFEVCARYNRPVLFHIADPTAFFKPLTPENERWEELQSHPRWHFAGPEYPTFQELMDVQDRFLAMYPNVKFQSAHVCGYSENLAWVGDLLDRHPNLDCDISARIAELGRVPRAAREFFIRHQDRILFGTDNPPDRELYRTHFRFLETDDEYFDYGTGPIPGQGRWCVYGLNLPDEVLRKVYRDNALKLYGEPNG